MFVKMNELKQMGILRETREAVSEGFGIRSK